MLTAANLALWRIYCVQYVDMSLFSPFNCFWEHNTCCKISFVNTVRDLRLTDCSSPKCYDLALIDHTAHGTRSIGHFMVIYIISLAHSCLGIWLSKQLVSEKLILLPIFPLCRYCIVKAKSFHVFWNLIRSHDHVWSI